MTTPKTNPWNLSAAEVEVMYQLVRSGSSADTAAALGKSKRTVEVQLRAIRSKMRDHTIGCCVAWAKWCLGDEDEQDTRS